MALKTLIDDIRALALAGGLPSPAQALALADEPDTAALARRRDGPALGSLAYRQAGGEPVLYSQEPTIFRVAV